MGFDIVKLGDISDITKLAGFEFTKYIDYIEDGEIIALRALNLRKGELDLSDIKRIDKKVSDGLTRSKLYTNDILLTYTGNGYGDCAMITENDKFHLAPNICKITPDVSKVNPYFLYSYIRSESFYQTMSSNMTGSSQPTIPMKTIRILEVPLPRMDIQEKMASFIKSIDEKTRVNRKINRNLQEQLEALYKENIKNSILPSRVVTLDELCDIFTGRKNANQNDEDGKYMFFTCGEKPLRINSYIYNGPAIIISGNGSYTGRTLFYNGKFDLYQRTYACTLKENIVPEYIFGLYAVLKIELHKKISGGTHGSSIPYIVMNDLAKFEFEINDDIFMEFSKQSQSILDTIMHNNKENEHLEKLRDNLLPKLMAGELDVSDLDI